jgi:hypothetical protein
VNTPWKIPHTWARRKLPECEIYFDTVYNNAFVRIMGSGPSPHSCLFVPNIGGGGGGGGCRSKRINSLDFDFAQSLMTRMPGS